MSTHLEWKWETGDREWKGKGDKLPRRSPTKRGKTCGRSFKAPRAVVEVEGSETQLTNEEMKTVRFRL